LSEDLHPLLKRMNHILEHFFNIYLYSMKREYQIRQDVQEINKRLKAVEKLESGHTVICPYCKNSIILGKKFIENLLKSENK